MKLTKVEKCEFGGWSLDRPLTVQIAGNVIDIKQCAREPHAWKNIEWIDAETYVDLNTGEIRQAQHSTSRGDKMSAPEVRRTLQRMRGLINSNWFGDKNELMVTLTYTDNMTDNKRLAHDLDVFNKRMKRALGEIKYLTAVEPQGRGAWHAHILVKQMTAHSTYWPAEDVARCWEHGQIIDVTRLTKVDNVGAYLSAYLSNAPAEDSQLELQQIRQPREPLPPKRVIKGARLTMYPRGMHLYRASRNLDKPIIKKMRPTSAELSALLGDAELRYSASVKLQGEAEGDSYLINTITHQQFVRKQRNAE